MTDVECRSIDSMIHKTLLPRIGVVQKFPLIYRHAPGGRYQGLGSLDTSVQRFILKAKTFITHANTESQLDISIKNVLESLHLQMGINSNSFLLPSSQFGFLAESSWVTHLWEKACEHKVTIYGHYSRPHVIRDNYFSLMEKLVESKQMQTYEMLSVNRCQVYLRVLHFSDIVNGQGDRIFPGYLDGSIEPKESVYK